MTEEEENRDVSEIDETNETGETAVETNGKSRLALGLGLLTLLVLAAIGISVLLYLQVDGIKKDGGSLASTVVPLAADINNLKSALANTGTEIQKLENQLADLQKLQSSASDNYNTLFRQQNMGNNDWALAEIEYLLILATQRLKLEQNVPLALAAMQAADDRIKNNNDPGLVSVRQQLIADMNTLKAVDAVDITGLVLYLSDLVGRVLDLPLQETKVTAGGEPVKEPGAESSNWEKLRSSVWQELKSLVQISRQGEETLATLMPEQRYFLYQNLRLQLESARYAVLRRDTQNLHVSVAIVNAWLNDYFDVSDNGVANIIESMSQMAALELSPVLPDIASSLESIRAHIKAREIPLPGDPETTIELEQ